MEAILSDLELLVPLGIAAVLGAVLGFEREKHDRPAGLRTHMIVAVAGAMITVLSELIVSHHGRDAGSAFGYDPLRVLSAIVGGVSFLGAGSIFFSPAENKVRGLTTAASLLVTIAVGVACGLGHWAFAAGATLLQLLIVGVLRLVEPRVRPK